MHKHTETTHRSVAWLRSQNSNGCLEMSPPYQRNPVWSEKQQSSLIETMMLEYPIPEIYMQDIVDEQGNEKHIVVDGQQRIRAVLDFISGEFELISEKSEWDSLNFDELTSADKKKIFEYKFVARILPDIANSEIRDIFQRINRNTVSLNAQELRHATYWGDFIKTMEKISDLQYWDNFNIFSANDRRRMLDTEFVSELAVSLLNGIQNKKTKLEEYYRVYESDFDQADRVTEIFIRILGEIDHLIEVSKTRFRKKSDFYSLFLALVEQFKHLPFSKGERRNISKSLKHFSSAVDQLVQHGINTNVPDDFRTYAKYVERAASDLGSRKARHQVLRNLIQKAISEIQEEDTRSTKLIE